MERSRRRRVSSSDDLALVKAAAWAWYQHGAGNEGKQQQSSEVGLAKPPRERRQQPSRYKLEAARASTAALQPLLDPYEIERITRQLDTLVVSNGRGRGVERRRQEERPLLRERGGARSERKPVAKVNGYSWVRQAARMCGSGRDAVDGSVLVRRGVPGRRLAVGPPAVLG